MTLSKTVDASVDVSRLAPANQRLRLIILLAFLWVVSGWLAACHQQPADPISGTWQAAVLNKAGEEVAFKLEIKREGEQVTGALVNGDERVVSTGGSFDGKSLKLKYDFYDGELDATLDGGQLRGNFRRQWRKEVLRRKFRAWREEQSSTPQVSGGPNVSGEWILRVGEGDQQKVWRASFRQDGANVSGTIIPVSGDWGTLTGQMDHGQLVLSRFDGINAQLFKVRLTERGTLEGLINSERKVVAERADQARSGEAPAPPDPGAYTSVKHLSEPFRFSFPDLNGNLVSSTDERFRNKVVVATITGSWCPNCHDEAPVLNDLYQRYRARGLEVVGLFFEYTGDLPRDREQVKIFARRHSIQYPVLLAGTTDEGEIEKKLPQLVNFGAYPTTIFIGRDGLVKKIHAGFEGPATGQRFVQLKAELEMLVKELLEEAIAE